MTVTFGELKELFRFAFGFGTQLTRNVEASAVIYVKISTQGSVDVVNVLPYNKNVVYFDMDDNLITTVNKLKPIDNGVLKIVCKPSKYLLSDYLPDIFKRIGNFGIRVINTDCATSITFHNYKESVISHMWLDMCVVTSMSRSKKTTLETRVIYEDDVPLLQYNSSDA